MALFMISIPYLIDRKLLPYICFVGLASLVHISALVLLPLFFLYIIRIKIYSIFNIRLVYFSFGVED